MLEPKKLNTEGIIGEIDEVATRGNHVAFGNWIKGCGMVGLPLGK